MTSMERVLTAMSQKEPDRVPLFLLLSMYGAKELGMSVRDYFSEPDNVYRGQLLMQDKYRNDCFYPFFWASIEIEAFGGETIFIDDGPPNAGSPIITDFDQIKCLKSPKVENSAQLQKVLQTIRMLKVVAKDSIPIIGVAISPFSLPVMQMGFDKYLDLIIHHRDLFEKLMEINIRFCIDWANAQLEAGATAMCYFDPISSPTIINRKLFLETGYQVARRTISEIKGPTATHLASGRSLPIVNDLVNTGTSAVGISCLEDIGQVKSMANKRLTMIGNLNGVEMCRWTEEQAEYEVKSIVKKAGPGGGLIISDNHGEIPYQVNEKILFAISKAVEKWGNYPLTWIENEQ